MGEIKQKYERRDYGCDSGTKAEQSEIRHKTPRYKVSSVSVECGRAKGAYASK